MNIETFYKTLAKVLGEQTNTIITVKGICENGRKNSNNNARGIQELTGK